MRKIAMLLACLLFLLASLTAVQAANVGVRLNINIGNRPPMFIAPSPLGFYVAIGVPYDLFYFDYHYYLYHGNGWYRSSGYQGPWVAVRYEKLPPGFRRHKYNRIIAIRNEEYRRYSRNHYHYDGRYFRPGRDEVREEQHNKHDRWDNGRGHKKH